MAIREGSLRPEFEEWYPGLRLGAWYPADQLTAAVLEQLEHGAPRWRAEGRVPCDAHFRFRGGEAEPRRSRRSRRLDSPRAASE